MEFYLPVVTSANLFMVFLMFNQLYLEGNFRLLHTEFLRNNFEIICMNILRPRNVSWDMPMYLIYPFRQFGKALRNIS